MCIFIPYQIWMDDLKQKLGSNAILKLSLIDKLCVCMFRSSCPCFSCPVVKKSGNVGSSSSTWVVVVFFMISWQLSNTIPEERFQSLGKGIL